MSRKVKSVSFNLNDPGELEIFEYSQQYPNFSNYVKRLILSSMSESVTTYPKPIQQPIEQPKFDPELMKQFI